MQSRIISVLAALLLVGACVTTINPYDDPINAADLDGDGFGSALEGGTDCDDTDASIHPDAPEICDDQIDNNCDGRIDDVGRGSITWYQDLDGDNYGDAAVRTEACPGSLIGDGFTLDNTDCDDSAAGVNPGISVDVCNGVDDDCDDSVDEDEVATFNGTAYESVGEALDRGLAGSGPAIIEVCGSSEPHEVRGLLVDGAVDVTIRSNPLGDPGTLVQPQGGNVVRVRNGARLVLEGLVIEGSWNAPAVVAMSGAQLSMIDTIVRGNPSGAIRVEGVKTTTSATLINMVIRGNGQSSDDGGGINASGLFQIEVQDSVIAENTGARGAGIHAVGDGAGTVLNLSGCTVESNTALSEGGGAYISEVGTVEVSKSTIRTNEAPDGAGLALFDTTVLADTSSVITENTATGNGGAIAMRGTHLTGFDITVNSASQGGGIYVDDTTVASNSSLDGSVLANNSASEGAGIAVVFTQASRLETSDCSLQDNMATGTGGGVFLDFATGRNSVYEVVQGTFLRNFPADVEFDSGITCGQNSSANDFQCSWAGCTVCL